MKYEVLPNAVESAKSLVLNMVTNKCTTLTTDGFSSYQHDPHSLHLHKSQNPVQTQNILPTMYGNFEPFYLLNCTHQHQTRCFLLFFSFSYLQHLPVDGHVGVRQEIRVLLLLTLAIALIIRLCFLSSVT